MIADLLMLLPVEQLLASSLFPSGCCFLGGQCKSLKPSTFLLLALLLLDTFFLLQQLYQ